MIEHLFQKMSDSAAHIGWELHAISLNENSGSFVLSKEADKIHFHIDKNDQIGMAISIWEGKEVSKKETPPIILSRFTALMVLAVILRFRLYSMV